ncbi:MAG: DinB family protein [Gemmatimonadetes bacterium]|nr:DinB family protein [Gemmatimonadota bacterium]
MNAVHAFALFTFLAAPLAAQQVGSAAPPTGYRETQISDLERERAMTLAMVDSMPDRLIHFKPVPEVRDFMQQIAHAALPVGSFAGRATGQRPPSVGDSTVYLNSKAALREAVSRSYDYCIGAVRGMSDAEYAGTAQFFGRQVPRWKIIASALEHSTWTRGEIVSYFRLNGMAPPAFQLFPQAAPER